MKELSIEEKAKRYDEALEKARKLCAYPTTKPFISDLQDLFPELKESEDERIELLNYLYDVHDDDEERTRWIAWLEAQGEHAKFRDSIQVGDKVTRNRDGVLVNLSQLKRVAKPAENKGEHDMGISEATKQKLEDNLNKALEKEAPESWNEFLDKQGEKEYALKSFKDEDVRKFMQYIEKQAKAYEFNLPNRSYDIYAFAKDILVWLEKQGEEKSNPYSGVSFAYNGHTWGMCARDNGVEILIDGHIKGRVFTNDSNAKEMFIKALERVEEQNSKGYKLTDCDKNSWWEDFKAYASCTVEHKPTDKVEPKFHEGEWITIKE